MRNFDEVDGVDITRRCWDGSKVVDEDKGAGESVKRGEGNESAEESIFDESDNGGGRVRLVSSAVRNKVRLKHNQT